ncbi:MAG: hypothetical protein DI637_10380 [Citromicrobium sp.]|nr:MAG: hypothetical protein DI637_10380 [Citromicrobium sp.]
MIFAMILPLLAQAAATEPADPPSETEVAEHSATIEASLDKWKGGIYKKDGKLTCRIEQSSGDEAVDLLRCGAMVGCYSPKADRLDAIAASGDAKEEQIAQMRAISAEVQPCLAKAHEQGVRRLAVLRASL